MRVYRFAEFGLDHLIQESVEEPRPGPGEVAVDPAALSLNYRDVLVVKGLYNPRLKLPATPVSDGAGVVAAVGEGVTGLTVGDRVMSHFVSGWQDGPFRAEYVATTLGAPAAGLAAERVVLPAGAVLPIPEGLDFAAAATLPIAALTAWSALVTVGNIQPGQTVCTLGTGGVSIFALQLGKALGARVIITSSSDEKLDRARALGADHTINYTATPDWDREVLQATDRLGADLIVENGGAGTLEKSMRATRAGGTIAFLGALTGLAAEINLSHLLMKRLHLAGILVDSRASFERLSAFLGHHPIRPVVDRTFGFDELVEALRHMEAGAHFGKIVIRVA